MSTEEIIGFSFVAPDYNNDKKRLEK